MGIFRIIPLLALLNCALIPRAFCGTVSLYAWGSNVEGELGNGRKEVSAEFVDVKGAEDVQSVKAGFAHTAALLGDGSVWCWGFNFYGQLGDGGWGEAGDRVFPVKAQLEVPASAVSAGSAHTVALGADGKVYAWGGNSYGQLGDGTKTDSTLPVQVLNISGVTAIESGSYHSLALTADGKVYAWGGNSYGQLGDGTVSDASSPVEVKGLADVAAISCGLNHSLALKSDGTLWAWGDNQSGQLGDGGYGEGACSPVPVRTEGISSVAKMAGGALHSVAVMTDGTAYSWGGNSYGQLGDGSTADSLGPVLSAVSGKIAKIAAGKTGSQGGGPSEYYDHVLAVGADGTVQGWGWNGCSQLGGTGTQFCKSPVKIQGLSAISGVAAGFCTTYAIGVSGTVKSLGLNNYGQLGDGSTENSAVPIDVSGLEGVAEIRAGYGFAIARRSDGTLHSWGLNKGGQLGIGSTDDSHVPTQVKGFFGVAGIDVSGRGLNDQRCHAIALKDDGTVWTWGANDLGQLGDSSLSVRLSPVLVPEVSNAFLVAAGFNFSMALASSPDSATVEMLVPYPERGTVNPGIGSHLCSVGEKITVAAHPAEGFIFKGWSAIPSGNATFANPSLATTEAVIGGNVALVADFFAEGISSYVTTGSKFKILAADVQSPAMDETFFRTPLFSAEGFVFPFKGRQGRAPVPTISRIRNGAFEDSGLPAEFADCAWSTGVALCDRKATAANSRDGKTVNEALVQAAFLDADLKARTVNSFGAAIKDAHAGKVRIVPPKVADIDCDCPAVEGSILTVTGSFFGSDAPKILVEYKINEKGRDRIRYAKCRILKSSYSFPDARGRPGRSVMDTENGTSRVYAVYPKLKETQAPTGYVLVENAVGIGYLNLCGTVP